MNVQDDNSNNDFQKLNDLIKNVRIFVRDLMNQHQMNVNHNKARREFELDLFYKEISFISKKWVFEILWELEIHQGLHFNELMRHLEGISSRSLSNRLQELKKQKLISRTVEETIPPKVLYKLTNKGLGFVELSLPLIWHLLTSK